MQEPWPDFALRCASRPSCCDSTSRGAVPQICFVHATVVVFVLHWGKPTGCFVSYPTFGTYVLLEHLGFGGISQSTSRVALRPRGPMCALWSSSAFTPKQEGDERHVVMFQDEARIILSSTTTTLLSFTISGRKGTVLPSMEYVPGMDLRSVQRSLLHRHRKRIPLRMALSLVAETLEDWHTHTRQWTPSGARWMWCTATSTHAT